VSFRDRVGAVVALQRCSQIKEKKRRFELGETKEGKRKKKKRRRQRKCYLRKWRGRRKGKRWWCAVVLFVG